MKTHKFSWIEKFIFYSPYEVLVVNSKSFFNNNIMVTIQYIMKEFAQLIGKISVLKITFKSKNLAFRKWIKSRVHCSNLKYRSNLCLSCAFTLYNGNTSCPIYYNTTLCYFIMSNVWHELHIISILVIVYKFFCEVYVFLI